MPNSPRSWRSSAGLVEARLGRSRLSIACLAGAHLAAVLPAFLLTLPFYAALAWLAAVAASLGWNLARRPVTGVRQLPDGRWRLSLPDAEHDVELVSWYAHPWLCVALFRAGKRFRRAVVVPYWLVEPEVHRRLRVALRASPDD
jgi:hypothetical protein